MKYKAWWVVAVLLIFADAGITYWAVTGGHAQEANPVVKNVMEEYGIGATLLAAAMLRVGSLVIAIIVQANIDEYKWTIPLVAVTVQAPPVVWNVWLLFL